MLKVKQHIKKITSMLLVMLLTVSSITPSYGSDTEIGGINGGDTSGSVNNSTDYRAWSNSEQGYRFYIINENFDRISPIYDFYFKQPTNIGAVISETRFDSNISPFEMPSPQHISVLASLSGSSVGEIPKAYANGSGNGVEFRKWFLKNIGFYSGTSGIGGGLANTTGGSSGSSNSTNDKLYISEADQLTMSNGALYVTIGQTTHIESFSKDEQEKIQSVSTYWNKSSPYADNNGTRFDEVFQDYKDKLPNGTSNDDVLYYMIGTMCSTYRQTRGYSARMCSYIASELYTQAQSSYHFARNTNYNILNQNIPLSGESDEHTSIPGCPAITLLKNKDAIKVINYESAAEALMDGCYLIVEPVTWLCMPSGSKYPSYRTYGSMENLLTQWNGSNSYGFYGSSNGKISLMNYHFPSCMTVESTYEAANGRQILQAPSAQVRTASETKALFDQNYGLAMHIYSASDLGSGTSTFDEPLGDNPGKAPDDSSSLTEQEKTNEKSHANIVKFYESYIDGELEENNSFTRETTPKKIQIEDEISYKVKDWYTSETFKSADGESPKYEEYKSSMSNTQTGQTPTSITLKDETTLYVLLSKEDTITKYEEADGDWILTESRLTRIAKTTNTDTNKDLLSTHKFTVTYPSLSKTHSNCYYYCPEDGYHSWTDPETNETHGYSCDGCVGVDEDRSLSDTDIEIYWKNELKETYKDLMSHKNDEVWGEKWNKHFKGDRTSRDAQTDELTGVTYEFLIHRAGKDKTMIYNGKSGLTGNNNQVENNLLDLGFVSGKINSPTRKNQSKAYPIGLKFVDDKAKSDNLTETKCDRCGDSSRSDGATISSLQINGSVVINTYAGIASSTRNNTDCDTSEVMYLGASGYTKTSGRMLNTGKTFRFVPFIQMQYDNLDEQNIKTLVTGQFERNMTVNDYAEVAWNTQPIGNLHVTSNQWSAHAGALKLSGEIFGTSRSNIMLPGGALYSLDTKNSEQEIQISTYQTVLIENGLEQAQQISQDLSQLKEDLAVTEHESYVESVINGLTNISVKQYVEPDTGLDTALGGIHVYPGANISSLNNGSSAASIDSKYYFKDDSSGTSSKSDENDLDAWISQPTQTTYYTFYSDVKGNIHMATLNSSKSVTSDEIILTKGSNADSLSNAMAKAIDNRTYIVRKLVDAIERNTGNDTDADWVTDGHWYNEAFNGVTVMVQRTKVKVGFYDPSLRTTVLDPKLIPQQTSKGTIFQKAFLSQFETNSYSNIYSKPNVVGEFKGKEIQMRDMKLLFQSNIFCIPDANVQDLS